MDFMVSCNGFESIEKEKNKIMEIYNHFGFCLFRGVVNSPALIDSYESLKASFDAKKDIRISGPIYYGMKNFQRLDCGDYSQVYARFSRMLTSFFWNESNSFWPFLLTMQKIRDFLSDRKFEYDKGTYSVGEKKYYEMPKLLQYPAGGGFMNEHYDSYNTDGILNIGLNIGMCVTKKGVHYKDGGLYYRHKNGEKLMADDISEPGDIFIHAGQVLHGVHPIDPGKPLDLTSFSGRVSLILSSESFPPTAQKPISQNA